MVVSFNGPIVGSNVLWFCYLKYCGTSLILQLGTGRCLEVNCYGILGRA